MQEKSKGTGMSFIAMLTDKEKRQLYEKIENNEYPFYGRTKDEKEAQILKDKFENE